MIDWHGVHTNWSAKVLKTLGHCLRCSGPSEREEAVAMATTGSAVAALKAHLAKSAYCEQLANLDNIKKFVRMCYPILEVKAVEISEDRWVIVCSAKYSLIGGNTGPMKPARMIFDSEGEYSFEVLLKKIQTGSWRTSEPPHKVISGILDTLLPSSGYVLCPGIRDYDSQYGEFIRFKSKNMKIWMEPIQRHDSTEYLLWHKPSNTRIASNSLLSNVCANCKALVHDLNTIKTRVLAALPGHKEKWVEPSSNRPLKYLSPASQTERLAKLRKAVLKYDDPLDVELSGQQDEELAALVNAVDVKGKEDSIFSEADRAGEGSGDELRRAWERDVSLQKEFYQDQLKNCKLVRCIDFVIQMNENLCPFFFCSHF